jgi:hypothetical protein
MTPTYTLPLTPGVLPGNPANFARGSSLGADRQENRTRLLSVKSSRVKIGPGKPANPLLEPLGKDCLPGSRVFRGGTGEGGMSGGPPTL